MKIDNAFPSKFLKASDVDEKADESDTWIVKMRTVEMDDVGEEQKPVLYFEGLDKGLVLNKTNVNTIMGLYGRETDEWEGKAIGLFTQEVEFQGKQMLGIRVRMKLPKKAKAPKVENEELFSTDVPF